MKPITDKTAFLDHARELLTQMLEKQEGLAPLPLEALPPKETLIVSIDMNRGFAKAGALYSDRVEALVPKTAAFLKRCDALGYQILPFSDCHTPASPELSSYPTHCMQGSEEHMLVEELSFLTDRVVPKNSTNGFFAGELPLEGITRVVVTGCCTDICIYQFAVTLKAWLNEKNLGVEVIVPMGLVETYDAPWHGADLLGVVSLESMMSNGVTVVKDVE